MKLRNKKTGENYETTMPIVFNIETNGGGEHTVSCKSITELNEKWEDAPEEPEEYWYIDADGNVMSCRRDDRYDQEAKEIGNYFESKEEAEKAVEKLKAWERLKDKGFRFNGWIREHKKGSANITIASFIDDDFDITDDIDLLFGGKE